MKSRQVYWRRKNKKIIAEGKGKNKTVYLFQLSNPEELLRLIEVIYSGNHKFIKKKSFLTRENIEKNLEIIRRLNFSEKKDKNND